MQARPERRILAGVKSNLGPLPPALAFRLETAPTPGSHAPRIAWEGESPCTAADLLRPSPDLPRASSALDEAREWLRAALSAGPRPAHDLLRESRHAGIARNTLYTAKRAEGIRAEKEHTPAGRWIWTTAPATDEP